MAIILPANTLAAGGFSVANSCRFNDGDSPQLHRSQPGTPTSTKIFTWSGWFKLGSSTSQITLASSFTSGSIYDQIKIMSLATHNQVLRIEAGSNESNAIDLKANLSLRDPSAWYHLVLAVDTSQGVAANRDKVYLNGTQITSWATETHSTQNDTWHMNASGKTIKVGVYDNGTPQDFFDGYLAEVVQVDGQQLTPTSFGEFDEDSPTIWKPINVSTLTFGNNGYYMDFEDSSALGNDVAGKGDFTVANLAAADQATDTPTNNFCTMNPLDNFKNAATFSEGNCKLVTASSPYYYNTGTFGLSNGKWYYECKVASSAPSDYNLIGIAGEIGAGTAGNAVLGDTGTYGYGYHGNDGIYISDVPTGTGAGYAYGATYSTSIIGVYIDLDNNKLYFSKDGVLQNSGTGISIGTSPPHGFFYPAGGEQSTGGSATLEFNFGGCPSFAISSGNTDGDYGNFEYSTTITGDGASKTFKALCTKNLAEYG